MTKIIIVLQKWEWSKKNLQFPQQKAVLTQIQGKKKSIA